MSLRLLSALALAVLLVSTPALADDDGAPEPAAAGAPSGEVTFVLAAADPPRVDKRLEAMKDDLRRSFAGRFKRFDFIDDGKATFPEGTARTFDLPGGGTLELTYKGTEGPYLRLGVEMPGWSGVVRVKDGRRFFQAGRKHEDGVLVIAIRLSSS